MADQPSGLKECRPREGRGEPLSRAELAQLYSDIWRLAWPAAVAQGIHAVDAFIARIIVAGLGERDFNTVNIGLQVFILLITVIGAVGVGTTALVAQCWGAGDRRRATEVLQQSLVWGLGLCVVIALLGILFCRPVYLLMDSRAAAADAAKGAQFLLVLFAALPVIALGFFFASALRGAGDTRTPMFVSIIMSVLSVVLSYGLILGRLGMPRLETLGAALALVGAFFVFSLLLAGLVIFRQTVLRLSWQGWRPTWHIGAAIFRIGVPAALEWILIQLGLLIYIKVVSYYGQAAAAGYFIGFALIGLAQTVDFGFQTAAVTLVGQSIGARQLARARAVFYHCAFLAFILMVAAGLLLWATARPEVLVFLFPRLGQDAISYARKFIYLLIFVLPLMGISFTLAGGLRGAGDSVTPLVGSALGVYGGRLTTAFLLYFLFQPPIIIVWCSMFPDLLLRIGVMAWRVRSRKWEEGRLDFRAGPAGKMPGGKRE